MNDRFRLFDLGEDATFGRQLAGALGVALAEHEYRAFDAGEHKTRALAGVRECDVYVFDNLYGDARFSANDKLCRLLFFAGALKDAAARRVTTVVPYLPYSRKDRKSQPRDPVTTRYVAAMFEAVGVDRVVTLDVHNPAAFQNAFRCRTEHLEARGLLAHHLATLVGPGAVAVVSPDAGGMKRAQRLRDRLAAQIGRPVAMAIVEKSRALGVVSGDALAGDVRGATTIIVDDMIATGGTIARAARACRREGAVRVLAVATHGLFADGANEALADPAIDAIVVSDAVSRIDALHGAVRARTTVLPTAPLLAEAIRRIHEGGSLVALLDD
jgi:ribose-phosphate pyrophosphokinase